MSLTATKNALNDSVQKLVAGKSKEGKKEGKEGKEIKKKGRKEGKIHQEMDKRESR